MNEDYDLTPEQQQQIALKKAKINRFCGNLGLQAIVLTTVYYATVEANPIADLLITGYAGLVGLATLFYFISILRPIASMIESDAMRRCGAIYATPTSSVLRFIGFVVSVAEIFLFVKYGFFVLAAMWGVCEFLQFFAVRKIKQASELRLHAEAPFLEKIEEYADAHEGFKEEVNERLNSYLDEIDEMNSLIEFMQKQDTVEGDAAADALLEEKDRMIQEMEKYLTAQALKAMGKSEENADDAS